MDVGSAQKVTLPSSPVISSPVISASGSLNPGTELSAARVVLASGAGTGVAQDAPKSPATRSLSDVTERRVTIDADTREIVRQSIDSRTNQVVSQSPDKAILGLRAYFDRMVENTAAARTQGAEPVEVTA